MAGKSIYRYRRIDQLLGKHRELESQEIDFASPAELNDPMEGFQDVFWEGDRILWKNLVKHYILCLTQAVSIFHIAGADFEPAQVVATLHWSASTLPTPMLKEFHEQTCAAFFAEEGVEECINLLARVRTRVRREELAFYLSGLHGIALHKIMIGLIKKGRFKQAEMPPLPEDATKKAIERIHNFLSHIQREHMDEKQILPLLFGTGSRMLQQMALLHYVQNAGKPNSGWGFLSFEFTDFYCRNIQAILYPSWYAACFVGNPNHAAMWAHYSDAHRGVCLKFRTETNSDGKPAVTLNGAMGRSHSSNGTSTVIQGELKLELNKINYGNSFPEIDFFRSLGRFPIPVLNKDWYFDSGEFSDTGRNVFADEQSWRDRYWANLRLVTTTKFSDWEHEDEYRLVVNTLLEQHMDKDSRIFRYNFSDLEGIIFGMNTSMEDKVEIVKIIDQKCAQTGRKEFEFLQANYSSGTNVFEVFPLRLIKLA
jgi:hypothetical protein